jgi:hypothetical protein
MHCFSSDKKHEISVMTVSAVLSLNVKSTCFAIMSEMTIHHSQEQT